jgi:hypothetical protein
VFAMRGFQQEWNVEVELREGERYDRESGETVSAEQNEEEKARGR